MHYCEHSLQLWFHKLYLRMSDHGSRRTWAQVLPDPDLGPKKVTRIALQLLFDEVFDKSKAEAPEAPHTPFMHPVPGGYRVKKPRTFPPLRTTSVPNFIRIYPAVWISVENKHTNKPTLHFIRFKRQVWEPVPNNIVNMALLNGDNL